MACTLNQPVFQELAHPSGEGKAWQTLVSVGTAQSASVSSRLSWLESILGSMGPGRLGARAGMGRLAQTAAENTHRSCQLLCDGGAARRGRRGNGHFSAACPKLHFFMRAVPTPRDVPALNWAGSPRYSFISLCQASSHPVS